METTFAAIFLATITVTRVVLFVFRIPGTRIAGFRIHHYVYGLVGVPAAVLLHSVTLYAIALALFVDELTFLAIGGATHEDNYSTVSVIGTLTLAILVCVYRSVILSPL